MRAIILSLFFFSMLYGYERTAVLMGTFVTLQASHLKSIRQGFEIIKGIERSLSSYRVDALVYRLNEQKCVKADKHLKAILQISKEIWEKTNGYFNPTIGVSSKIVYRFSLKETLPNKKTLSKTQVNFKYTYDTKKVCLPKNTRLDFGGIAKGYAVDRVAELFRRMSEKQALIALSGDIRCFGKCYINVDSPFYEGKSFARITPLQRKEFAISTSGIYRNYVKNIQNNHIVNPFTKMPQTEIYSLSLFGNFSNTLLDGYATAVVAMGFPKGLIYLKTHTEFGFILITKNYIYIRRNGCKIDLYDKTLFINYDQDLYN